MLVGSPGRRRVDAPGPGRRLGAGAQAEDEDDAAEAPVGAAAWDTVAADMRGQAQASLAAAASRAARRSPRSWTDATSSRSSALVSTDASVALWYAPPFALLASSSIVLKLSLIHI